MQDQITHETLSPVDYFLSDCLAYHFSYICVQVLQFSRELTLMSVHDRVTKVVQSWGQMPSLPDDKQELEVIWASSGPQFEFYPYGAQDLTERLHHEFRESGKAVLYFTDIYAGKNTGGKVKTVDDLANAVRENYRPR
ncbi:MAG: hypothetical protein JO356_06960 [Acidobacteria bacterium]|nr:hypothetical protein [Acidobacteriota bacterium]